MLELTLNTKEDISTELRKKETDFTTLSALPSGMTYSRADTTATYRNSSGKVVIAASNTPRFDYTAGGVALGPLCEESRTNKCTVTNYNVTATTGLTLTGTGATISVVNDAAALAAAGLDQICTNGNVYCLDNSGGSGTSYVDIAGQCGNTNPHSVSVYARSDSGTGGTLTLLGASTPTTISGTSFSRYKLENVTPSATARTCRVTANIGRKIYFVLHQLEEAKSCSSPIANSGASTVRQAERFYISNLKAFFGSSFNQKQGGMFLEFDTVDITNNVAGLTGLMLSTSTTFTNCISAYMVNGRSKIRSRSYIASVAQTNADYGSIDKAGEGALNRNLMGFAWKSGKTIDLFGNCAYKQQAISSNFADFDRLYIGSSWFTENINGHIRKLTCMNRYRPAARYGKSLRSTTDKNFVTVGQSNSTGFYHDELGGGYNTGEKSGVAILDTTYPSTRNFMVDGGTSGTSVLYMEGVSTSTNWWYNSASGVIGTPFQRCLDIMKSLPTGSIKAIIDVSGESDAVVNNKTAYKAAQLIKFNIMRAAIGSVPVIIVPIGRRSDNDNTYYTDIRETAYELAAENPSWIFVAPERFDLALGDIVHMTDAANGTCAQRMLRKALKVLGETITGSVDGPQVTGVSRSGATVTVTLSHDAGTDFTPTTGIAGFHFFDNTTEINISSAVRTNATTITLTLASTPSNANQTLYYGKGALYSELATYTSLVKDNSAQAIPLKYTKFTSSNTGASFAKWI